MDDVVVSVAAKIAEYLVDPVVLPIRYLSDYKRNYQNLKTQVEKLKDARERIHHSINDARRRGEEIEGDVEKWLISVNKSCDEAERIFEHEDQEKNWCLMGLCPNFMAQYRISKKSVRRVKAINKLLEEGQFDRVSFKATLQEIWPPITGYEVFESRLSTLNDVLNALINPDVSIIGVYGMGGVGKTMLVKHVARQAKKTKLFDEVVYVVVTQALDVKRTQGEIADELGLEFSEESENGRARKLCARLMSEKKVLVILDNIWWRIDLDAVGIPFGEAHKGCKILLTSRSLDVLYNEMDSQINFLVRVLNEEEAWLLFKKMAGDSIENSDLQSVGMDVVKVCDGLPISIVTIARALRNKSVSEWKDALLKLRTPSPENFEGMNAVAYSTIELSYNRLEGEELKSTFLLCSLLGYNYSALITDLVKYGMGLGLYRGINTMQEARDRVYTLVYKLKAACLLLDSSTSEKFAMHDVVRDVAISIAFRDRHMFAVRNTVLPKDWFVKNVPNNCTALSLRSNNISELPEELECPDLQLFYIYSKDHSLRIPDNFFRGEWVPHDAFPHLESMFLHNLINLEKICRGQVTAESFSKLRIMKVEYCYKLRNIFSFSNARDLPQFETIEVNECSNMEDIFAIENKDEIDTNEVIEFSQLRSLTLKSLPRLTNFCSEVKSSNVPISEDDIPLALFSEKVAFPNLEVLELVAINFPKLWHNQLPAGFSCIQNLTRLIIWGCGNVKYLFSSSTIGSFEQVQYLEISNCSVLEEIIFIDELRGEEEKDVIFTRLNYIKIEQCPVLRAFILENISVDLTTSNEEEDMRLVEIHQDGIKPFFNGKVIFPSLEEIVISHMDNLEMIWNNQVGELSFCKLKLVEVECCNKLQTLFTSNLLERFTSLKSITVSDCGLLEEIFQIQGLNFEGKNCDAEKLALSSSSYKEIPSHGERQIHAGSLAQIKTLKLSSLSDLKYLWKEDSTLDLILQDLEILYVSCCENLINLTPSSAALQNLTTLNISTCGGLINLVTPSTAKSLVRLEQLNVYACKKMTEVIANEGEATEAEIIFRKLKRLSLDNLSSLTSFCSGNHSLKFPSLEEFIFRGCPQMSTFSRGVLSTPRLRKVQLTLGVDKECLEGDLNTTMQQLTGRSEYGRF
ncbi:disease resistance protein SUMM2-like isoform X3 [Mangifera indica]|uniref:disease resistance protein SUMM2-like isoform X3 n=1 Tax=Mangifera indica TaxID=29780 RepID=UPI001CFBF83B|nr:disease resistance protein SUMM2-like isoform X3 [Mangifera indica]